MYEIQKNVKNPKMGLFMEIDRRIENAIEMIIYDIDIPKTDIKRLMEDRISLLEIFEGQKDENLIQYNNFCRANNLIDKINYILELCCEAQRLNFKNSINLSF